MGKNYTNVGSVLSVVRTGTGAAYSGKCAFWGAAMENYDADATATFNDSTDGSGTDFLVLGAAAERGGSELALKVPVICDTGIHVTFAAGTNNVTVFYTPVGG